MISIHVSEDVDPEALGVEERNPDAFDLETKALGVDSVLDAIAACVECSKVERAEERIWERVEQEERGTEQIWICDRCI